MTDRGDPSDPEAWVDYQQTEIEGALDAIDGRLEHVTGDIGKGLLDGVKLREHQNDRLQAYLEGYADALNYAGGQVEDVSNLAEYAIDSARREHDPAAILTDVLKLIWGENPQAPVSELDVETLLERLVRKHGRETVVDAVRQAGWDVEVPGGEA